MNTKLATILLLAGVVLMPACNSTLKAELAREQDQRRADQAAMDDLKRYQTEIEEQKRRLAAENQRLRDELGDRSRMAADATAERQRYLDKLNDLEKKLAGIGQEVNAGGGNDNYTTFQTPEGTVIEIKEGVLFDSGKKDIKTKGAELLQKISAEIAATPYNIRIDGHTDADPVKVHIKEYPLGNIQLSAERSLEVAGFFMKKSTTPIAETRIAVAGFGAARPKSTGVTNEAKRQNRRVDIVILNAPAGTVNLGNTNLEKPNEEKK